MRRLPSLRAASWHALGLKGDERVTISGLAQVKPRQVVTLDITRADGSTMTVPVQCRIDTLDEIEYFKNGGILHYVLRNLAVLEAWVMVTF